MEIGTEDRVTFVKNAGMFSRTKKEKSSKNIYGMNTSQKDRPTKIWLKKGIKA